MSDQRSLRRRALKLGADAELVVGRVLQDAGYRILDRNWRGGGGELDLVVIRQGSLRFVEVKARDSGHSPDAEVVTSSKERKLIRAADAWLDEHDVAYSEACFAVALVEMDDDSPRLEWIDDAFDGS